MSYYSNFNYVLIARALIYKNMGPGDQSNIGRVPSILHFVNSTDIGARFLKISERNWCTKRIDSDVRCTKFEHSILERFLAK